MNRVHNPAGFSLNATSSNKFPLTFFSMILLRGRTSCCEPCSLLSINLHLKGSTWELHILNILVQTHLSWVSSGLRLYILWWKHRVLLQWGCLGFYAQEEFYSVFTTLSSINGSTSHVPHNFLCLFKLFVLLLTRCLVLVPRPATILLRL